MRHLEPLQDEFDLAIGKLVEFETQCLKHGYEQDDRFLAGIAAAIILIEQLQIEQVLKERLENERLQRKG